MKAHQILLRACCLLAAAATAATATPPTTHVVTGKDDALIDRPAIQAAVDAAAPGDTIRLEGLFQLDGTPVFVQKTRLTIAGLALDNDGDGALNEDRPNGVDDDGDGLVDEDGWDAVLRGVDDGAGGPASDVFPDRFNDAFEILGFDDALAHIAFRDLEIQRVNRAIYLFPDYDDAGTVLLCDAATPRAGSLRHVTVARNAFVNNFRGVEILGRVRHVNIRHNLFADIGGQAVLLFGQTIGCAEPDGSIVQFIPLGTPFRTRVVNNELAGVRIGLMSFISDATTMRRNEVSAVVAGVLSVEDERLSVTDNDIESAFFGVLGTVDPRFEGPSRRNRVAWNTFTGNFFGVVVDCLTTGYRIVENEFVGSAVVDVQLDGTAPGGSCEGIGDSFENTVIANLFATTVLDFGVDNRVLGDMVVIP